VSGDARSPEALVVAWHVRGPQEVRLVEQLVPELYGEYGAVRNQKLCDVLRIAALTKGAVCLVLCLVRLRAAGPPAHQRTHRVTHTHTHGSVLTEGTGLESPLAQASTRNARTTSTENGQFS
jgi:hypothetical protein